jgi:ABC-type Fe3+ transport system permease subunit
MASLAVFGLAAVARHSRPGSLFARTILLIAVSAGLLGPLVLSLAVLAAVQLPGLISLRDTPVPLVFTLGLVLVPLALVLKRVLELTGQRSALHLAALMPKSPPRRELMWRLSTSGKFWAVALLFVWAYWDLTASAILAPIGMTPVTVRLYNLMHYGQIAALSAMTCAAFLAPVVMLLLVLKTRRWWAPQ